MSFKSANDNGLGSDPATEAQEQWKNLGVPLRVSMHRDVHKIAQRQGMKAAQWARLQIANAVAAAKAA